jgi:hypothetical protein
MGRRVRSIDRKYAHSLVIKPLIAPRSTWESDVVTAETRAIAAGLASAPAPAPEPETPLDPPASAPELETIVVSAVADALTPEPYEPLSPAKSPRRRKEKPVPPPCNFQLVWDQGIAVGWRVAGKDELEPLFHRPRKGKRS